MPPGNQYRKIEMIASLVQSVAIVLGVCFAVYEFVLKDRQHEKEVIQFTIQRTDMLKAEDYLLAKSKLKEWGVIAQVNQLNGKTHPNVNSEVQHSLGDDTKALQYFYKVIESCISTKYCDRALALSIVCDDARADNDNYEDLEMRVGNRNTSGNFSALIEVVERCKAL